MKRILALGLAVVMLFALCACNGSKDVVSGEISYDIPEGKAIPDDAELDVLVLSHASWPYRDGWKVWEYIKEGVGGHINVTSVPSSDWGTKFPLIMAAPESFPDLMGLMGNPGEQIAHQGAIIALDDYAEFMPDYVEYCENLPENEKWMIEIRRATDGKIYYTPIFGMEMEKNIRAWLYRKDIFDKHGLKTPETIDELYEVSKKLKEIYPDSYPFCMRKGLNNINVIGSSWKPNFHYNVYYDFDNQEFRYGATEDTMLEIVQFFNKMVKEKLTPENFFTINDSSWQELIATDRGFIAPEYQVRIDFFQSLARSQNPEFTFTAMKPPATENGLPMVNKFNSDPSGYVMMNTKDKGRIANAARYLNWFYTDEAMELLSWGKEGETFETVDGEKVFLLDEDNAGETATTLYGFKTVGAYTRIDPTSLAATVSDEQFSTTEFCLEHTYPEFEPVNWLPISDENASKIDECNVSLVTVVSENIEKFIIGKRPLSEWDNFQAELAEEPIEELLAIYESIYADYK